MKRILLVTDGIYPFQIGGMQKHAFYLTQNLIKEGYEVDVLVPQFQENTINYNHKNANAGVKFIPVKRFEFKFPMHYFFEEIFYSRNAYKTAKKLIKGNNYEIVLTKGFVTCAWPAQKTNFPKVGCQLHGLEMFQKSSNLVSKLKYGLLRPLAVFSLHRSDFVLSYGGEILKIHQKLLGKDKPIYKFHGAVNLADVIQEPVKTGNVIRLLFIGRNERRKAIPEISNILKKTLDRFANCEVHWIGELPAPYKISHSNAHYYGQISSLKEYYSIIDTCDILLLPSFSEGFPTVILEAMSRGLTTIAMNVGAISEIVNNKNGWIVNTHDEFEQVLMDLMRDLNIQLIDAKKACALATIKSSFIWSKKITELREIIKKENDCR